MPIIDKDGNVTPTKEQLESPDEHWFQLKGPATPLMLNALKAMTFMVELREAAPHSISNKDIVAELQKMVDNDVLNMVFAVVALSTKLKEQGILTTPGVEIKPKSRIILPKGMH